LHDDYAGRLSRLGLHYTTEQVPDVRAGGRFTDEHAREREAESLLERAGGKGTLVALDERGEMWSSPQLAERIERWATPLVTLVIGGPTGLHPSVLERADHAWSLSRLTFPHELVRALVAEQLYRVLTIRRGHRYHK
jgi:23S rRNA (pseudouridine1915-N3)-methyltransferase